MRKLSILLIVAFALLAAGCSDQSTSPEPQKAPQISEQDIPARVQTLLDLYANDENAVLPEVSPGPEYVDIPDINDTSYDIYSVTFLWGEFLNAGGSTAPTDWSGTLSVNAEAIISVLTTIDFEKGEDSIVATDVPSQAVWVSQTYHDFDGISFLVFLKRGNEYFAAPWLQIETGPFTQQFYFAQLEQFAAFYVVDNQNAIGILAHKLKRVFCPSGPIAGTWTRDDNAGDSGSVSGLWYDGQNQCIVSMAGRFTTESDGSRHIKGTLSGCILTVVLGEFEGTWLYDDPSMCPMCGTGHGIFKGHYKLYDGHKGFFAGEFGSPGIPFTERELPMKGFWKELCSDVSVINDTTGD